MTRFRRLKRHRRGAALVEFALCVPILLLVVFAIFEFARVMQLQAMVCQAAFTGARAGLALDAVTSDATTAATSTAAQIGVSNATITVTPITYTSPTITVTVSVSAASNGWFTGFMTGGNPISSTITLDREIQAVSVTGS